MSTELDALIAEQVMGWGRSKGGLYRPGGNPKNIHDYRDVPRYSTDVAAAWAVRAEMERRGWESEDRLSWIGWGDHDKHPFGYSIWFKQWEREGGKLTGREFCHHDHVSDFNEAPAAICRAALACVAPTPPPPSPPETPT